MSNETIALLKRARERIAVPERWTQGADCKTADGRRVLLGHDDAVCWCGEAALELEAGGCEFAARAKHEIEARLAPGPARQFFTFNDNHTHAEVLALFDRTIADLEAANV